MSKSRILRTFIASAFGALAGIALVGESAAYVLLSSHWDPPVNKWNLGGFNSFTQSQFILAMNKWNGKSNFSFTSSSENISPCNSVSGPDGKSGVRFDSTDCGRGFGSNTLAVTWTWFSGSNTLDTDMVYNNKWNWGVHDLPASSSTTVDFRRVSVHELGHALGLGHETVKPAIMQPIYGNVLGPITDDINGLRAIYGGGGLFQDVPTNHPFYSDINKLVAKGITGGCSTNPPLYCPSTSVKRDQMAVFLERALGRFSPPGATGTMFRDVPRSHWAAPFIEQFAKDGITKGCSTNPPYYCPGASVTRAQMAVFLLRAKRGASYNPPPATGSMFSDVSRTSFAANWIEQLVREGITGGCGGGKFCPDSPVSRGQMAAFIVRTFNY